MKWNDIVSSKSHLISAAPAIHMARLHHSGDNQQNSTLPAVSKTCSRAAATYLEPSFSILSSARFRCSCSKFELDVLPKRRHWSIRISGTVHVSTPEFLIYCSKRLFALFITFPSSKPPVCPRSVSFPSSTFSSSFSLAVVRVPFHLFICSEIALRHPIFPDSLEPTWVAEL